MRTIAILLLATIALGAVEYRWPDDAGIIDVKRDFGAKGDGRSDDTAAIQAAFVAALEKTRQRQMVYIPDGTYLVSASLRARITDAAPGEGGWSDGWR